MFKNILTRVAQTLGFKHQPLTPEEFTQLFAAKLRKSVPDFKVETKGELSLTLTRDDGMESNMSLGNAYHQYQADPKSQQEVFERYIASARELTAADEKIKSNQIIPIIKDRPWLDEIRLNMQQNHPGADFPLVYEELNDSLVVIYAEDTPSNIRYFSQNTLQDADLQVNQLRSLAVSNLRRLLDQHEFINGPDVSMITVGGNYEASLLLFDEIWQTLEREHGEVVVAVPARDLLLFTSAHNPQGVQQLQQFATQYANDSAYRLTDQLFVYRDKQFVKLG